MLPPHTTRAVQVLEVVLLPPLQNSEPATETPTVRRAEQIRFALAEAVSLLVFQARDKRVISTPVDKQEELYSVMAVVLDLRPHFPQTMGICAPLLRILVEV